MNDSNRFPDSAFDRIGVYLPEEYVTSYYRDMAHLRALNPKDELLILAEGMAGVYLHRAAGARSTCR